MYQNALTEVFLLSTLNTLLVVSNFIIIYTLLVNYGKYHHVVRYYIALLIFSIVSAGLMFGFLMIMYEYERRTGRLDADKLRKKDYYIYQYIIAYIFTILYFYSMFNISVETIYMIVQSGLKKDNKTVVLGLVGIVCYWLLRALYCYC